jgi:hypothetical protein
MKGAMAADSDIGLKATQKEKQRLVSHKEHGNDGSVNGYLSAKLL